MNATTIAAREEYRSYVWPLCCAVLLHAAIFWLFTGGLESLFPEPDTKPVVQKVIKASLVTLKPKPQPQPKIVKKTPVKPKPKPKAKPKVVEKPKAEKPKTVEKKVEEKPLPAPVDKQAELDALLADEDLLLDQEEELSEVARYSAAMTRLIERHWSRPPSARNNMQAVLDIKLVPTGDVVSVSVKRGSGNGAFDRSAILAVEKIGRFDFIGDMPPALFESYFRRIELTFKPEDLRL